RSVAGDHPFEQRDGLGVLVGLDRLHGSRVLGILRFGGRERALRSPAPPTPSAAISTGRTRQDEGKERDSYDPRAREGAERPCHRRSLRKPNKGMGVTVPGPAD